MNGVEGLTITPATCSFWQRTVRNYCDGKSEDVREVSEILFLSELLSTRGWRFTALTSSFFRE